MSNIEGQHSPLFRREATASSGRQWLGTIHLAQPLSSWLISGLAFVILLAFITETERRLRLAQNEEHKAVLTQRLQSLNAEANQLAQMEIQRRWNM
ncbi:hypothetical protein [Massilia rhizosphaerae]|uniref:hypothetical protein n=1 Tax=Massilia rhizosphaerae TaxID=2784389 RepID=UPI0018DCA678|nr:hypothetical protein [Massilia rhizosphaerae]